MLRVIFLVAVLVAVTGCGTARVNVDMDSCESRGKLDGIRVGSCIPVKVVK